MKLIVTENQFSKIRLIKESEEYMNKFKDYCAQKLTELIKVYNTVMNMSLYELISSESIVKNAYNAAYKINNDIYAARKNMNSLWEKGLIGSDIDEFDMLIDEISDDVYKKSNALYSFLSDKDHQFFKLPYSSKLDP
jgi:hypothetical protein